MKYFYSFVLAFFMVATSFGQNEMVVRLTEANQSSYDYFTSMKYEITAFQEGRYLDILINQKEYQDLQESGWNMQITQTTEKNKQNLSPQKDIDGYHTYDEALTELQDIAAAHPEICTLSDIADSHGKTYYNNGVDGYENYQHDIWMLKISDNVNENEDEPAVFYLGAHHSREPISTEVVLGLIHHLIDNYGVDDEITYLLDNTEVYFVPMVNPDGHEVVLDQLNTWWRKTAADNNNDGIFNYTSDGPDGVDPNRNYGWQWGTEGASGNPNNDTYHGPSAFSEPEIAAMRDLMAAHHFTSGITFHSYSELVLYPYGYSANCQAPDHQALEELAVNMANSIPKITGSGHYTPEQSNDLYPASGVTDDWAYGNHGIFCFTVELAQEFIPPASQVPTIISDNIESAMMILNRPHHKTLRGHVYDAETLEPVTANVFVNGIDDNGSSYREPYKSDQAYGAYYRLLTVGNYDVTYSAYGYISQSFEALAIVDDEATIQDVYLQRAASGPVMGSVLDGETGANIEGAEIIFLNTPVLPVYTNQSGVYEVDDLSYDTYTVKVSKDGYAPLYIEQSVSESNHTLNFVLLPSEAINFEEGSFGDEFSMSGNQPWVIDNSVAYDGDYSSASGNIGDNQSSVMKLNIENRAQGSIRFYKKVSTEAGYDFLKFYIDGSEQNKWSGNEDWSQAEFPLTEGNHELKWSFTKDGNTAGGSDKVWVDFIEIPPILTTVVNAGPDLEICTDEIAELNAYAANYTSLSWSSNGDGSFSDQTILNPSYTPGSNDIANGSVELSLTAEGTQSISDQLTLNISICTGIKQMAKPNFILSPNPASNYVYIQMQDFEGGSLEIISISGIKLFESPIADEQKSYLYKTSELAPGIYMVKLIRKNGAYGIQRLLIQ